MAKVCRACQMYLADRGGVCNTCRHRILKDPITPTARPRIWMLAVLLVGLLSIGSSLIAAAIMTNQILPWRHRSMPLDQTSMVVEQLTRTVYPYSIVPGGAENLDEAKRALETPAVKANYADLDLAHLRKVKLKKNLSGYVSYRWGEEIYWSSTEQTLHAGETVFTDGVYLIRGRCLNSYSQFPMLPTREDEPTEQVLDTPAEIPVIVYAFPKLPLDAAQLLTPTVPIFPSGSIWFSLIPIIPPIHRHSAVIPPAR